jgi:hypothetical protein
MNVNLLCMFLSTPQVVSISSGESGMPGIFFSYELAPMMVKYTEREK